jgi:hypothetical protein
VTNKKQNKKTFKKETKETLYGNTSGSQAMCLNYIDFVVHHIYLLIDLFIYY